MAASDPTPYVATPTGTLQGVAAFSWDGSAWQPSGRAGPDVATPTGVLQGVAAFNADSGATWQPSGRAGPSVATPTGVLEGVAVHYWDGSAWRPRWSLADGWAINMTPSGVLRGVAAFSWDGSAWQPAGQAGPTVATPYGPLDGVAFFNWSGSTWQAGGAAPAGATLDLSFLSGSLDPRITFTRASTATYFDATGTMQTAATNAPRFDYDPVTHAARGLLIEEARTNIVLQSQFAASWPATTAVLTANAVTSPDGGTTAATLREDNSTAIHIIAQTITKAASVITYAWSVYAKQGSGTRNLKIQVDDAGGNGVAGIVNPANGAVVLDIAPFGTVWTGTPIVYTALPNGWGRFTFTVTSSTVAAVRIMLLMCSGTVQSYAGDNTSNIQIYGCQLEQGAFPTSYIPTTAAAVTRAVDVATMPWVTAGSFSHMAEGMSHSANAANVIAISDGGFVSHMQHHIAGNGNIYYQMFPGLDTITGNVGAAGGNVIYKTAATFAPNAQTAALNGVLGTSNTFATLPAASTTLRLCAGIDGSIQNTGYIRRVRFWPRVLSNAELQSVTT